jgi:hypothetical protein
MKTLCLFSFILATVTLANKAWADFKVGVALDIDLSFIAQVDRYNIILGKSGFAVEYDS